MSGRLEGIGATLQEKDGYIKVTEIVTGSPSWRQGELQAGDIIMKVAQGDAEAVDIVDMRLDKAVQLIRGPKGTEVRLTLKKVTGEIKTISIIRDIVVLEETYAKSAVITRESDGSRVGYIFLPKFYADFSNSGGRNCSDDVAKEVEKLKKEKVDAIVLDLRNNSGGSLNDVVKMTGLFIERGPIVQVKSRGQEPYVLEDRDSRVQYDGPLVVMVNSGSASASEILAAAIQDYHRGVIMGTPTYGKGTVQRFFDLDQMAPAGAEADAMKPLGSVKLTTQKFYRINGGTTQLEGVTPDVLIPDPYTYLDRGEEEQDYPMPWDEIKPVPYSTWLYGTSDIKGLAANSYARIAKDECFKTIDENAKWLKSQQDHTTFSLQLDTFRAEEEKEKKEGERFKDIQKEIPGFAALLLAEDKAAVAADTARMARSDEWLKNLRKDHYLLEAVNIVKDMSTYPVTGK
jgi:carboxyl-terminal processing protease